MKVLTLGLLLIILCVAQTPNCPNGTTSVKIQLHWVMQAQFVHFVAAVEQGFYAQECLDVAVLAGGPGLSSIEWINKGVAQFGTSWVQPVLGATEAGFDHVIIAQQFQMSGTLLVVLKSSNITQFTELTGKRVATWAFLDAEVKGALNKESVSFVPVSQTFGPTGLMAGSADAVMAMTYNEYAQLLETTNPTTGKLWKPEDFLTFDFNSLGTGVLQDSIIVSKTYMLQNEDVVRRFLRGSMKGFAYCREDPQTCVNFLYAETQGGRDHQRWQMNEINKLVWFYGVPFGTMNSTKWKTTLDISRNAGTISQPDATYDNTYNLTLLEIARQELLAEGFTVFDGSVDSNASVLSWCTLGEDNACGNAETAYLCTGKERGREPSYNGYDTPTGIAFLVVASFGIILTLITLFLVIIFWDNPIIRTATPEFLVLMLLAIIGGFVSIYFWLGEPTTALCVLRYAFPTLSFVLMFAPLLAKTWRIWYIFRVAKKLRATRVHIWELVPIIVLAFAIQAVITICWLTIATPQPGRVNPVGDLYTYYLVCDYPNDPGTSDITVVFYGLTVGYNGLLLIIGAILAYSVRKMPSHFNESKAISFSIYNLFLISLIILILSLTLTSPTTVGLFLMLGFFLGSLLCLVFLFFPKFFYIFVRPDKIQAKLEGTRKSSTVTIPGTGDSSGTVTLKTKTTKAPSDSATPSTTTT